MTAPETQVSVITVAREQVREINSVNIDGETHPLGEHRDFRRHQALNEFLPDICRPSFAWVRLRNGETLANHQHPSQSMIIVCHGSVELTGDNQRSLIEGDIVCVPPHSVHGFRTQSGQEFHGLSIQFEGKGLYEDEHNPRVNFTQNASSLTQLEQLNDTLTKEHTQNSLFQLFASGRLQREPKLRDRFISALHVWSTYFQRMIQARQAVCTNKLLTAIYREHFREELDHDVMLSNKYQVDTQMYDPALEAACSWFVTQMYQLDEAQKIVVVHLVVESSGHVFGEATIEIFADKNSQHNYFDLHASVDGDHTMIGRSYLKTLSASTIHTLIETCQHAWHHMNLVHECIAQWTLKQG